MAYTGTNKEYWRRYREEHREKLCNYHKEYYNTHKKQNRLKSIYATMIKRCYSPKNISRKYYKDKGIRVCDDWLKDYKNFESWALAHGYKDDLTIERVNVNGNYCPENCKWATYKEQQNNTSRNRLIAYAGQTHTLKQWSEITGISYHALHHRLVRDNWSTERALTTPTQVKNRKVG